MCDHLRYCEQLRWHPSGHLRDRQRRVHIVRMRPTMHIAYYYHWLHHLWMLWHDIGISVHGRLRIRLHRKCWHRVPCSRRCTPAHRLLCHSQVHIGSPDCRLHNHKLQPRTCRCIWHYGSTVQCFLRSRLHWLSHCGLLHGRGHVRVGRLHKDEPLHLAIRHHWVQDNLVRCFWLDRAKQLLRWDCYCYRRPQRYHSSIKRARLCSVYPPVSAPHAGMHIPRAPLRAVSEVANRNCHPC
mmetsp:Transcript_49552/g.91396  ORF Transcript_49552/g.91396 Transcript_49552/m.91396 type:complete len:239 (+) Transcript_49552:1052-1768(+)